MPQPRREAVAPGVELSVFDTGAAQDSSMGPVPVVLCHGFPELAFSWRHQIRDLARRGIRVIAPDQRGYGLSDSPESVEAFDIAALTGDIIALLDSRGIAKAVIVGHDWGGLVAWALATRYPERVDSVISLNTPYTKRAPQDPISLYRKRFGPDHYIVFFQEPGAAEAVLEADVERVLRFYMRRSDRPLADILAEAAARPRPATLAQMLAEFDPADVGNPLLSDSELAVYTTLFTHTGFRGPVNWYRNFTRNWQLSQGVADHVPHPCLMVMAENDLVLPPSATDGMEKYVPDLTRHLIPRCGHWTQQERPQDVTDLIHSWVVGRRTSK
jgi:pimeloyl-ACP methyl ester carboxylesterase